MSTNQDQRIAALEQKTQFLEAHAVSLQTVLVAALQTINTDAKLKEKFALVLAAAVEGSYDHAIGTDWSDETISLIRQGIAVIIGKDLAAACRLP